LGSYIKLGLVHRLDPLASGGVEPSEMRETAPPIVAKGREIPAGFGKIKRDAEGNVVGVEIVEAEMEVDDEVTAKWTKVGGMKNDTGEFLVKFFFV
jgi:hypothetical protein